MINRLTRAAILLVALTVAVVCNLVLPAAAETQKAADGATVTGPDRVVVGQGISISGTGWVGPPGAGSVIAVKLDDGKIERKTPIVDPATRAELAADIFALVQASPDGSFTATVEFPTSTNATKTWAAGSKGSLRLLTGKLLEGDEVRSTQVSFQVVSGTQSASPSVAPTPPTNSATTAPTPDATKPAVINTAPDAIPNTEKAPEARVLPQVDPTASKVTAAGSCSDKTTVKLTGESTSGGKPAAPLGGSLKLSGSGWCTEDGSSGSVIVIKIDDGKYAPVSEKAPRGGWQVINVGSDGSFSAVVKVPTANETKPAFTAGAHALRLLTGSSKDGDKPRSLEVAFVATGGGSTSSPSSSTTTNSTNNSSNTSNNSSTTSTNSTSGKLAATGGSRPGVLVIGLLLVLAGIAVLRRDVAEDNLRRNES